MVLVAHCLWGELARYRGQGSIRHVHGQALGRTTERPIPNGAANRSSAILKDGGSGHGDPDGGFLSVCVALHTCLHSCDWASPYAPAKGLQADPSVARFCITMPLAA